MEPNKGGRPTSYSDALADEICYRLTKGEALFHICSDPEMPNRQTILNWANEDRSGFSARYSRARQLQADAQFDDMMALEAKVIAGEVDANAARVVLHNQQWRLGKMANRYSDKMMVDVRKAEDVTELDTAELLAIAKQGKSST